MDKLSPFAGSVKRLGAAGLALFLLTQVGADPNVAAACITAIACVFMVQSAATKVLAKPKVPPEVKP